MSIHVFGPVDWDGHKLIAAYEYEAPDPEVGLGAIYTVVSLTINDSPFDAMSLIDPAVVQWIEDQIAAKHDASGYTEGPEFDDWRNREAA